MYLKLENITKTYNGYFVFDDISLLFDKAGMYYIKGNSGSGKTTLLNIIAGIESFDCGKRIIDSKVKIGYIFQTYELIEEFTVKENIMISADLYDLKWQDDVIDQLGLSELLERYPSELSGGQRQRVGIARALMLQPNIIICDEPMVSLDQENRMIVLSLLKKLSFHSIVIVASHNEDDMIKDSDYVYEIKDKNVYTKVLNEDKKEMSYESNQHHINKHRIKYYIKKFVVSQKKALFIIILSLTMIGVLFIQIEKSLFHEEVNYHTLNSYAIYVYQSHEKYANYRRILTFEPLEINNKFYQVNVYPYLKNDNFQVTPPINNEIIVNDYFMNLFSSNQLEMSIGDSIEFIYELGGEKTKLEFVIKDIIHEETKNQCPQIYYSYDYVIDYMKSQYYSYEYQTQYDYFMNRVNNYEIISSQEEIKDDYVDINNSHLYQSIYNSVLSYYYSTKNHYSIYHVIFVVVQIVMFFASLLTMLYQNNKFLELIKYRLSILNSLGVSLDRLKKIYMSDYLKCLIIILFIVFIEIGLYFIVFKSSVLNIYFCIGYTALLFIINLCYILVNIMKFKETNIAELMKRVE